MAHTLCLSIHTGHPTFLSEGHSAQLSALYDMWKEKKSQDVQN